MIAVSHHIHAHPELGFEEEQVPAWLAETLDGTGCTVTKGIYDFPTAFMAWAGSRPLHLAICVEDDGFPGVGQACGYNIIAAMSVGASLAAADATLRGRLLGSRA
jgi:metal-dependent amidase/aminoacylase/carboxypeptidase family protein